MARAAAAGADRRVVGGGLLVAITRQHASVRKAAQARAAGGTGLTGMFPFQSKGPDPHQLLMPRLNVELAGDVRQEAADNGYELWRKLNRQLGPPREDAAFHMITDMQNMGRKRCTTFPMSCALLKALETKVQDYVKEVCERSPPRHPVNKRRSVRAGAQPERKGNTHNSSHHHHDPEGRVFSSELSLGVEH